MDTNDAQIDAFADAVVDTLNAEKAVAGLTLDEIADRSAISRSSVVRYLSGDRDIPLKALTPLAGALGLDVMTILERAQDRASRGR